jgi:hypothetical protein
VWIHTCKKTTHSQRLESTSQWQEAADRRRNSDVENQESMGDRFGPCKTTSHAGDYGLHVWKFIADIFYYDGIHAVGIHVEA